MHGTLTKSVAIRQYFYKISKSPNTTLAPIYKSQILFWQLFTNAQILFWQLFIKAQFIFTKAQILFWHLFIKAQYYSLTKAYFHILKSLTYGKHKTTYDALLLLLQKLWNYTYFSIRNSNYESPCMSPMAKLFIL